MNDKDCIAAMELKLSAIRDLANRDATIAELSDECPLDLGRPIHGYNHFRSMLRKLLDMNLVEGRFELSDYAQLEAERDHIEHRFIDRLAERDEQIAKLEVELEDRNRVDETAATDYFSLIETNNKLQADLTALKTENERLVNSRGGAQDINSVLA